MTVICENCQTANRDKAKFCIGCAGKLPAFAATGPAATGAPERMRRQRQRDAAPSGGTLRYGESLNGMRWWFAAVLLIGAFAATLVGWIALTPGRATVTVPAASTAASAAAPALAASSASPADPVASAALPAGPIPFESALAPGETAVISSPTNPTNPSGSTPADASVDIAPAADSPSAPAPRTSPAPRTTTSRLASNGRADPRVDCEHLFFAFAARCEANHCAQTAYARHPRCDVVRAERQRDDARRNMTSGY